MRLLLSARLARLALAMFSVVMLTGCPSLNQWSGPNQDPFFSVPDPLPPSALRDQGTGQTTAATEKNAVRPEALRGMTRIELP